LVSPVLGTAATLGLTVDIGYVFGPVGAVVGALLGNFLFDGGGANVEGPRLGDLTVGASTYGNVIPSHSPPKKIAARSSGASPIEEQKEKPISSAAADPSGPQIGAGHSAPSPASAGLNPASVPQTLSMRSTAA